MTYETWYRLTPIHDWHRIETIARGGDPAEQHYIAFSLIEALHVAGYPFAQSEVRIRSTGEVVAPHWSMVSAEPPADVRVTYYDTLEEMFAATRAALNDEAVKP